MIRARFGRIVNVSSIVAATGSPGQANYAAAKAGLVGLSRSVAREVATRNVTVNVVEPGPIATAMTDALPEARRDALAAATPMGRFGTPDEVAAVVALPVQRRRLLRDRRGRAGRRRPRHGPLTPTPVPASPRSHPRRRPPMDRAAALAALTTAAVDVLSVRPTR